MTKAIIISLLISIGATKGICQKIEGARDIQSIERKWLDVSYANASSAQKLDIYLPNEKGKIFPVIISIHGGAFMSGDKADNQVLPMLTGLERGYAIISINYRLSGEAKFPAQIFDVKAAIRWVKANATKYNLDPDKHAVWGGSAGGHLASLAGTSAGVSELEDLSMGNSEYSSRVQAVVDWFGPIDFLQMDEQFVVSGKGKPDHSLADSPESKLLGQKITEIPELVKKANPTTYISGDDPPFLIEHGTDDRLIPTKQSIDFANQLERVMGSEKVKLIILNDADHGGPQFATEDNLTIVFGFLDAILK